MANYEQKHNHNHSEFGDAHNVSNLSGKKIFRVVLLNVFITVAEIIGGILSGSLALLSDSIHNLSDTVSIVLSYIANKIAQKPKDPRRTYGYKRAEIISAFVNSTVLLAISSILIFEAFKRLKAPENINGTLMIIVASAGLIANLISVFILEKDSHENLNIKSSYLHLISDTVSSLGVVAGGIAIKLWGIVWIDPLITVLISLYILKETWIVMKTSIGILMQSSADLDYKSIRNDVEAINRVKNIHHVHSWMINEKTIFFEAHIEMEDMPLSEAEKICNVIEHILIDHYGINHVTLQTEIDKCEDKGIFKI